MTASVSPATYALPGADGRPGWAVHVVAVGLACCGVEVSAAARSHPEWLALGAEPSGPAAPVSSCDRNVLVLAGTLTDKLAPGVRRLYDALPVPRAVISYGSCANSGGPYWDSYSVTKGVDQLVPVDAYVAGCPPRPEALLAALHRLELVGDGR
jgi:NADH-quinone oxidoreductase subunit B